MASKITDCEDKEPSKKFTPWFYQTVPSPSRFAKHNHVSNVKKGLGEIMTEFQNELRVMKEEACPKKNAKSLSKFLGGNHDVEEMLEDVRRAERGLGKSQDDCSLKTAVSQLQTWRGNKYLLQFGTAQVQRAFSLKSSEGRPIFPTEPTAPELEIDGKVVKKRKLVVDGKVFKKRKLKKSSRRSVKRLNLKYEADLSQSQNSQESYNNDFKSKDAENDGTAVENPIMIPEALLKSSTASGAKRGRGRPPGKGRGQARSFRHGRGRNLGRRSGSGRGVGRPTKVPKLDIDKKEDTQEQKDEPRLMIKLKIPRKPPADNDEWLPKQERRRDRLVCTLRLNTKSQEWKSAARLPADEDETR